MKKKKIEKMEREKKAMEKVRRPVTWTCKQFPQFPSLQSASNKKLLAREKRERGREDVTVTVTTTGKKDIKL